MTPQATGSVLPGAPQAEKHNLLCTHLASVHELLNLLPAPVQCVEVDEPVRLQDTAAAAAQQQYRQG
jgi:hypothetical protein